MNDNDNDILHSMSLVSRIPKPVTQPTTSDTFRPSCNIQTEGGKGLPSLLLQNLCKATILTRDSAMQLGCPKSTHIVLIYKKTITVYGYITININA